MSKIIKLRLGQDGRLLMNYLEALIESENADKFKYAFSENKERSETEMAHM